jgi:hypothetical protein
LNRELCLLATIIGMLSAVSSGAVDEEVPDAELLEFLGSWENQDDWQDFFDAATESDDETLEDNKTNGSAANAK